jgi:hypothetical protein
MKITKALPILLYSILIIFQGCKQKDELKVDLSDIEKPKIEINRYGKALFSINRMKLREGIESIRKEYKFFLGNKPVDSLGLIQLDAYLGDPFIRDVYEDCIKKYPNLDFLEKEFSKAFRHYKYYFPQAKIPKIYTYISGLEYERPIKYIHDSILVIALDMYLGEDYENYARVGIPQYKTQRYRKENIVPDCMKEIGKHLAKSSKKSTLLDHMAYHGKLLLFTEAMCPSTPDSVIIAYTPRQMQWCKENEDRIWSYFIEEKLLYEKDLFRINKLIGDGPFTSVFTNNSAPRTGRYIGWQMTKQMLIDNEDISLKTLMMENYTGQDILQKSRYKPQK